MAHLFKKMIRANSASVKRFECRNWSSRNGIRVEIEQVALRDFVILSVFLSFGISVFLYVVLRGCISVSMSLWISVFLCFYLFLSFCVVVIHFSMCFLLSSVIAYVIPVVIHSCLHVFLSAFIYLYVILKCHLLIQFLISFLITA